MTTAFVLVLLAAACPAVQASNQQTDATPIQKVMTMLADLEAKVSAESASAKKEYEALVEGYDDKSKRLGFEIKTGKAEVKELNAAIAKGASTIAALNSKVDELAATISSSQADLDKATALRAKEAADYAAGVKESDDIISTISRAIAILEKEMKGGASMMQLKSVDSVAQALAVMVQASSLSSADAAKLTALVQNSQDSQQGDEEGQPGAPAGAVYVSQSGGIVSTLEDLLAKAQEQLSSAQKAETAAIYNFEMLAQSLSDEIKYAKEDMASAKKDIAAAAESKAIAEGDLSVTTKDLEEDIKTLAATKAAWTTAAEDYEVSSASRAEELKALAEALKVLKEMTSGAGTITYGLNQVSLLQIQRTRLSTGADLANFEAVHFVRDLARKQNAPELTQLAMRMASVMHMGNRQGEDPFAKVKGLIMDMIERLSKEADADASKKAYCDKETAETKAAIEDSTATIEKLTTKIDAASAKSSKLKEEVAALEKALAAIAKDQADMDATRQEEHGTFVKAKAEMEAGIEGVKAALKLLKEYYAQGQATAATGAGEGIIELLEVVESDFTKGLSEMVATEDSAAATYDSLTKENEIDTATKNKDVEYKTKESAGLDKEIAELTSDKAGVQSELDAKNEYLAKLDPMCVAKAETYAAKTEKRADRKSVV